VGIPNLSAIAAPAKAPTGCNPPPIKKRIEFTLPWSETGTSVPWSEELSTPKKGPAAPAIHKIRSANG
jgi:hypothetical protein